MGIKRHKPEEIVTKLRQVEVLCGQGMSVQVSPDAILEEAEAEADRVFAACGNEETRRETQQILGQVQTADKPLQTRWLRPRRLTNTQDLLARKVT